MVKNPRQKPNGPHFAAILFQTRSEWSPGYDRDDSGSSSTVDEIVYFAFPDKETLKEWVIRAANDKKQYFFFEVKKMGEAQLKVDVDLGV